MDTIYDLIIIGAGPAGLSAAIYASRANLNVLVIETIVNGGKLSKIHNIENYPGIDSISGFDLSSSLIAQAKKYNANIITGKVISVDNKTVKTTDNTYSAKAIIIASGSTERKLAIENADAFEGRGISYCATCDGFFFKNKNVVVIGDNNTALEEALYLSTLVKKLTFILRGSSFNGDELLINKVKQANNIEIINNVVANKLIIKDNKLVGLNIINNINQEKRDIECEGIFPYIDFNPSTEFVPASILNENGYINVNEDMSTAIEGIYAAGDCINKKLRQIVTACSDGALAATSVIKYLKKTN